MKKKVSKGIKDAKKYNDLRRMNRIGMLVLTVTLGIIVSSIVSNILRTLFKEMSYFGAFLDLLTAIFIFIPLFGVVDLYIKKYSKDFLAKAKKIGDSKLNNKKVGFILGFLIAFIFLFFVYAFVEFDLNILESLV